MPRLSSRIYLTPKLHCSKAEVQEAASLLPGSVRGVPHKISLYFWAEQRESDAQPFRLTATNFDTHACWGMSPSRRFYHTPA